jgi:hypothetical protein
MENLYSQEDLLKEFGYIIERINKASFESSPFKHLIMFDFLSPDHFQAVTEANEINRPEFSSTENLIQDLFDTGYQVQNFPGCTTSKEEYLKCFNSNKWPVEAGNMEGFGLTLRLRKMETPLISRLLTFLNSDLFSETLKNKFEIQTKSNVNTSIQKYLHAYEISPHPDERNKALTYLLNINTNPNAEKDQMHTFLMQFKPERRYIYDFWKYNPTVERCWVPWNWCEKVVETSSNNSFIIFAPDDTTLHAVKLNYNHLKYQRTQIYGNLFYENNPSKSWMNYDDIDLLKEKPIKYSKIKAMIPKTIKKLIKG